MASEERKDRFMNDALKIKAVRWSIGVAKLVAFILAFLSVTAFLAGGFAHGFVPSTDWMKATNSLRFAVVLISVVLALGAALKFLFESNEGELKKVGAVLIAPFIGYAFASASIVGAPIILAIFAGHHVELPYKVAQANGKDRKGCRSPVDLQDLPFFFSSLCGVSEEFRESLRPGMPIIVEGRGTSYGVYASDFRRMGP
ncbi:hypothetical protein [Rhizobium sp. AP16]|uniref:hypothetical protein n=1 Tax=Rhizobium sp. AP16 TaxID=1144306 RepID=UPI002869E602|nr:hypothetical protein [Rhizobium sp. AP16]